VETSELLKKIRRLEIRTKGLTKHIFSGEYHSAFKGRGMAFSEVRDYHFGDEIRTIDWNVTARYNEPYVKVFNEERELTIMLVIDVSGSTNFGTTERTKRDLALETAAILAFSAIENNDKVGAIFLSDTIEKYIAPEKGKKHTLLILRELMGFNPKSKGTNINEGLKFLRNTQKKRTISFVISDFTDDLHFIDGIRLTAKRHDTIAIRLKDVAEEILPDMGIVSLFNAETGNTTWVNSSDPAVRERFSSQFTERETQLTQAFNRAGIDHVTLSTDDDIIRPLITLFKHR
jgi:uncharacterized protein (DUF58 family)